jgi:hypothetical protein
VAEVVAGEKQPVNHHTDRDWKLDELNATIHYPTGLDTPPEAACMI